VLVYLIDGTYELFRAFYGTPSTQKNGKEIGATRTLLRSFAGFLREPGVTHVGVAFDTVIESFRNELFAGYKTGEGIDPALWSQFPLAERATRALGLVTWSMIDFETDDALATAAARFADDPSVEQIRITSPDKDFCQCVRGDRVVVYDRKKQLVTNEEAAKARLGVAPAQVPAFLALVGDTADGIPGIARWGEKGAAAVLNRYLTIDAIPADGNTWDVNVRGKAALAAELNAARPEAALYEKLATLRTDVPLPETLEDLRWRGPNMAELKALCSEVDSDDLLDRFTDTDLS
jgi:5'-3' exonuclease